MGPIQYFLTNSNNQQDSRMVMLKIRKS